MSTIGSLTNFIKSLSNILFSINIFFVSIVGVETLYNFFFANFHKVFLKKFNLGKPDILNINLHLKLNISIKIKGKEVSKWRII